MKSQVSTDNEKQETGLHYAPPRFAAVLTIHTHKLAIYKIQHFAHLS
jgi:hypothetical protein